MKLDAEWITGFVDGEVLPEFTVVQHERDVKLLQRIIPFFVMHPLKSEKREDFEKFHGVLRLMEAGEHLTTAGVNNVRCLTAQMNRGRSR